MTNPKYTFLLPAFKARYLEEALRSIKNQTYKDFKVLVSDDCSPEDLKSIYDKVVCSLPTGDDEGEADTRFEYRRNAENMGSKSLVSHWNLLVDMCDTEYLIMASDDDVYEPNFLEEIDRLTEKYPEVDLFRGRVNSINEKGNLLVRDAWYPEYMDQAHFFRINFASNFLTCEACYCYKTETLKQNGGYVDFPSAWFTDDATHIKMAKNGCSSTETPVFNFRQSTLSISNTFANAEDARKKVEAAIRFKQWIDQCITNIEISEEISLVKRGMADCERKIIRNIESNIQFCQWKDFRKYAKISQKLLGLSIPVLYYNWIRVHK